MLSSKKTVMVSAWYAAVSSPQTNSPTAPPKSHHPKSVRGVRASAIDDESCVSMVLVAVLAASVAHTVCTTEGMVVFDYTELIISGFLMATPGQDKLWQLQI